MKKTVLHRTFNRFLHMIARNCPGAMTLRPLLHRMRGVRIGKQVWIGDDVYLESEYPELVELQEGCVLSIRSVVIAHTRGQGNVIIERHACVGPNAVVCCSSGRTLRIGEGAVISTGSVVTSSVASRMVIAPPRSVPVGRARVPFGVAESMEQFIAGMEPLRRAKSAKGCGTSISPDSSSTK